MNKDVFKANWNELKGHVRKTWGKITDDEIEEAKGNMEVIIAKLHEKYGMEKEEARTRLNDIYKSIKH